MKSILNPSLLLPIGLLLLQTIFFFFICVYVLRRARIIQFPLAGLEYSNVIVAGSVLFGVFYITTADIQGLFQAYKTYHNLGEGFGQNTFIKFGEYYMVLLFLEVLYAIIGFGIIKLLLGYKNSVQEIQNGNIPGSILMAVLLLSISLLLQRAGEEIVIYLTPQYITIR
jgi:hypothetical protein